MSYINNLHPQKYKDLYSIIEEVINSAIPLWNMTLTPQKDPDRVIERIKLDSLTFDPDPDNIPRSEWPQKEEGETQSDFFERQWQWEKDTRKVVRPEPENFHPPPTTDHPGVDLARDYHDRGLQVIVKLANIELTPEKPSYEGGTWHVEGQLVSVDEKKSRIKSFAYKIRTNTSAPPHFIIMTAKTSAPAI